MSRQRPSDAEDEVGRVLRQASDGYGDLPDHVGDRLDRVLESLPAADTLHGSVGQSVFERWADRLRTKRFRYALVSAAAAVLVVAGGIVTAVQFASSPREEDSAGSAEVFAEEETARDNDEGVAPNAEEESPAEGPMPPDSEAGDDEAGISGVETFATGSDYSEGTDLLAALRELGSADSTGDVPAELADLAAGGEFWQRCEEAITREYGSLLLAVDFARYESEPAIMALMLGDSGETAVALTPACADGVIEALTVQS